MPIRCAACRKDFQDGDDVQPVPALERVLRGEKSGALGVYPQGETVPHDEQDFIHHDYHCYEMFFSPTEGFLYDSVIKQMGEEWGDTNKDEIREEYSQKFEEVKEMIGQQNFQFCVECWAELDADEPPVCLWCKSPDFVWMHQKPQGMIFCCTRCNKYWDNEEEELEPPR